MVEVEKKKVTLSLPVESNDKLEKMAQKYLKDNKYEIIENNYYTRNGEIDIIASKNNYIILNTFFMNKELDLMADYVFLSMYSQKKRNGELENWNETINRIYSMHLLKLNDLHLMRQFHSLSRV